MQLIIPEIIRILRFWILRVEKVGNLLLPSLQNLAAEILARKTYIYLAAGLRVFKSQTRAGAYRSTP